MSKYLLNDTTLYKYSVIKKDDRCFIESKIQINNIDIIVVNIHPESENKSLKINYNKDQIIHLFNTISSKYNINNIPIIIAGDFNTNDEDTHNIIRDMGFISVHKIYNNLDENAYSGYHGTLIDYIYLSYKFINLFKVTEFKIFNLESSDHYPLFFKFKLKEDYLISDLELNYNLQKNNCLSLMNNYTSNLLEIRKCIIDLKKFMKKYKYEDIVYIPEGIYLAHGTSSINFDNSDIPYEINSHSYTPKSFTLLNNPGESFMSWYGINDEISLKRLVIYKVKRKIPILNLFKNEHNMQNRIKKRFKFY